MPRHSKFSPEELLQQAEAEARKESRGKFKIYLGAAPGVGKTYEMLHDAKGELQKGLDVIIGIVETHGREEIVGLLHHFEIIPQQNIEYRGKKLTEFDLDAALKRSPALILIDEMAHTNAPEVRHHKRWQDIKEILDRGIDVYTTLNVQHIESLNDDVAQIIHAPIKETVPDSMIEMADTIELVDLSPDDLLRRLSEGKVYFPQHIHLAREHYFQKGNLIALRQLALRITAERVGAEVLLYRKGEGIKTIWPVKDKILVCVGPKEESLKLIRAAKRIANSLQAEWCALYVDHSGSPQAQQNRRRAIKNLQLAEQLGAQTRVLMGLDRVKEILKFARDQNVTQIMLWKYIQNRWLDRFRFDLADEMVRQSGDIDVYIMTGEREETKEAIEKTTVPAFHYWKKVALALSLISAITVINVALFPYIAVSNLMMIYFLGLVIIASFGQTSLSVLASVLSVLIFNFLFIPPYQTFAMINIEYVLSLFVMLFVSLLISQLTMRIRNQVAFSRVAQHQLSVLYTLSHQLSKTRGTSSLIQVGIQHISAYFNGKVEIFLPKENRLISGSHPEKKHTLNEKEYSIVQWVYELGEKAGLGTDTLSFSKALYLPLIGSHKIVGVLSIQPKEPSFSSSSEQTDLLEACIRQIALALEAEQSS